MTTTQERWARGRPALDSLPGINGGYDNSVSDWLTDAVDSLLTRTKFIVIDDSARQVDPLRCDEQWLDLLAALCGWQGIWDRSWPVTSKRQLLANSYTLIWPNKGTAIALSFVLDALGVTHVLQQGDSFIIGESEVGDALGAIAWEYNIVLPTSFFGAPQVKLAERINRLFGPIWCKSRILFDDDYFIATGFPVIAENTLLAVDDQQTVLKL